MIVFSRIKFGQRDDFGDNGLGKPARLFQLGFGFFGDALLLRVIVKDCPFTFSKSDSTHQKHPPANVAVFKFLDSVFIRALFSLDLDGSSLDF
jgi:hypothetical protein